MSKSGSGRSGAPAPKRKFYVRSGKVSWLVLADDAEVAAQRFVQNALKPSMISGRKPVNEKLRLVDVGAMKLLAARLDSKIFISESGFTGSDAGVFNSEMMVKRWHARIVALEEMIRSTE